MRDEFGAEATVASNVKAARKHYAVTQKQLSERLSQVGRPMSVATISLMEAGRRRITVDELAALGRAFDCGVATLLRSSPFLGPHPEELREYYVRLTDGTVEAVTASSIDTRDGWLRLSTHGKSVFSAPQAAVTCVRAVEKQETER